MPPVLRRRAIDALLQGLCFHYDPLANRVQCSITTLVLSAGWRRSLLPEHSPSPVPPVP